MNVFAKRNGVSFRDPADKYSVEENYAVAAAEHSSTDTETEEEGKAPMEESVYSYSSTSILRRDFGSQMTPVKREDTTSLALSLSLSLGRDAPYACLSPPPSPSHSPSPHLLLHKVCYRRWLEENKEEDDAIGGNGSGNMGPPADEAARAAQTPEEGKPPPHKKMRPTMMPQNGRKGGLTGGKSSTKPMAR
jgi:hypothetical protein